MSSTPATGRPSLLVLAITYLAFISLGLPDSVLGVAWPTMRETLKLPLETLGILTLVGTVLSASSSFLSGNLTKRFSTGPIILVSILLTSSALLIISNAPSFVFILLAAIPLGIGAGSVDSGLNAYVAKHYSARHMNWLHSFWGGGATLGPLVMTAALGIGVGWRGGYLWICLAQAAIAVLLLVTLPLWKRNERRVEAGSDAHEVPRGTWAAGSAAGWISVLLYVLYAAAEMGAGLWANSVLIESRGLDAPTAGLYVACYFGAIMAGRMIMGFLVPRWGNRRSVNRGLLLALVGAGLFFLPAVPGINLPLLSLVGLVLMGLGFAPIYPCLMHETPQRFNAEATPVVIGRQVGAAYVGGALFPGLIGLAMANIHHEVLTPILVVVLIAMGLLTARLNKLTP
jgi:fucose permease